MDDYWTYCQVTRGSVVYNGTGCLVQPELSHHIDDWSPVHRKHRDRSLTLCGIPIYSGEYWGGSSHSYKVNRDDELVECIGCRTILGLKT